MARVAVPDDVWTDFRSLAGRRPIAEVLGELVTERVDEHRTQQLADNQLAPAELIDALERAQRQQADLALIAERLQTLHALDGQHTANGTPR